MTHSFIASYDFGTSGVKATFINLKGEVCGSSDATYSLITPNPGWAEQDPNEYWSAACLATKKVMKKLGASPSEVQGIVFGTQWKGIIPIDEDGEVLYNTIIWLDGRADKQAKILNNRLGINAMYDREYWPKLMWIKEEMPELYNKTKCFLEVNSYLKFLATGVKAVDLTNNFILSTNQNLQDYYNRILVASGLDKEKFPPLVLPTELVGGLTEKASEELGLDPGTPVFGGCGDIPAIAIGSGSSRLGGNHIYLGSSGWFGTVIPERKSDIGELYQTFGMDKDLMIYPIQSACMTLNWAISQFYKVEKEIMGEDIFTLIDKELADVHPGSLNMIATPWIHGELRPLSNNAKAVFFNITNQHERRHFLSAIMEGICYMLRWKIEIYQRETGKSLDSINVVGGGACSDPWMQIMANVLQIPVSVPSNPQHAGAVGAAYCAMIGLGIYEDFEEADERIMKDRIFLPRDEHLATYDRLFSVFKRIYPSLKDMYETLNNHVNAEDVITSKL
ncbi:FGGY-family carbohydrate kinase [Bacillus sp. JJ1521]|uniref:xylulokinase n=1 Tax=Bacillus sp. JJ1521 TaxID=3122957 RepID=UPI002FFEDCC4